MRRIKRFAHQDVHDLTRSRRAFAPECCIDGQEVQLSCSMGLATWRPAMGGAHEFMCLADAALLRAKAAGRDCVRTAIMTG